MDVQRIMWVLITASMPSLLGAQQTTVAAAGGAFAFDLSGTGTAPMVAVRVSHALVPALHLEGGVAVAWPDQQFGDRTTFLAPEAQLKWFPWRGRVAPYLGIGAGWIYDIRSDRPDRDDISFSASAGLRIPTSRGARSGLELEVRPRFIETGFVGSSGDFTVGWFFGI